MFKSIISGDPKAAIHDDQIEYAQAYLTRNHRMLFLRGLIVASPPRVDSNGPVWIGDDIIAMNRVDSESPIYLFIDSPGGDITTGFALFDIMMLSKAPITTVTTAAASMATVIMQAAKERVCFPHSRFMLHLPSGVFSGDADEVKIRTELLNSLKDELIGVYLEHGVTAGLVNKSQRDIKKRILSDINKEKWLDAKEAIAYGLVDRIVTQEELMG
jgi:ATP-dependent Clp protease protease subunit